MNNFKKRGKFVKRIFDGIWIPKEIWLLEDISIVEKCLLAEIRSLDNEEGCYASNKYFSKFFKVSEKNISNCINNLIKKKYINLIRFDGRKRFLESCIVVLTRQSSKKVKAEQTNSQGSYINSKENNTINNTYKKKSFSRDNY